MDIGTLRKELSSLMGLQMVGPFLIIIYVAPHHMFLYVYNAYHIMLHVRLYFFI